VFCLVFCQKKIFPIIGNIIENIAKKTLAVKEYGKSPLLKDLAKKTLAIAKGRGTSCVLAKASFTVFCQE